MQASGKTGGRSTDGKQSRLTGAKAPGGTPRTRTFTGCRTCRNRHLKCDETRPLCSTCQRLGLECEGYEALLYWMPDEVDKQSHRGASFRYPLFSEDVRSSMSLDLVQSLRNRSAGDAVISLDAESPPGSDCRTVGPFGVFRAFDAPASLSSSPARPEASSSPSTHTSPPSPPSRLCPTLEVASSEGEEAADTSPAATILPVTDSGWHYLDALQQQWIDTDLSHAGSPGILSMDTPTLDILFTQGSPQVSLNINIGTPEGIQQANEYYEAPDVHVSRHGRQSSIPRGVFAPTEQGESGVSMSNLPAHADCLLRHFKEGVLNPPFGYYGQRTSPWRLFSLPCALETFAELALWNTASHTRYSILYSLLSNSAFHLHGTLEAGDRQRIHWLEVATNHHHMAKLHLKEALQTELVASDQSAYNEILMAILALAMISTFHGPHTVKILLLDAEGLIRMCGLPNPKTFKSRVFHHMYTHMRLMNESLAVSVDTSSETQVSIRRLQQAVELKKFRISEECLNSEFDLTRDKPSEIGYNDIHLEVPGKFPPTLYPEMYGIPESLMTLLSRTISIANEKSKQDVTKSHIAPSSNALSHHIRTLEQNLWSWSLEPSADRAQHLVDQGNLQDQPHTRSMVLALHQALLLYFYRRIYNVSAMALQSMVQKAFEHLESCFEATVEGQDFATTVAWTGFIAACEATGTSLQERGLKYLQTIDQRGILFGVEKPSELARKIWGRREQSQDWSLGWPDLMRSITAT